MAVEQVRAYCIYQGGFHEKHIVVLWLWQALSEFTNEQRCKFLKFVTGSDRVGASCVHQPRVAGQATEWWHVL